MPSKSPTSVSGQSGTSGSGSGTGNPKANFKHSLPQQLPLQYFVDIRRRLDESIASSAARRAARAPSSSALYNGEDHVVCRDMIEACRLLESAPPELHCETATSSATSRHRRSAQGTSQSSSTLTTPLMRYSGGTPPPPSPISVGSARPPLTSSSTPPPRGAVVALSHGKTSDGLYGLNHYPSQKDVFNGPAQTFMENDCHTLASVTIWQSWAEARTKFFDAVAPLAAEVFTFACVDETIVAVSPSTPTAVGAAASRSSPSTPFRRSPRPDYEAKLQELQSRYVKVNPQGSSYLHFSKALLVHVWRCGKAAERFSHGWQRYWQALFEHRIAGIHCPLSVVFNIQGISVSVTALPPVYVDRVPPIHGIFSAFFKSDSATLHQRSSKPLCDPEGRGCQSPLLSAMVCRLFAVLHLPQDDAILDQFEDVHLFSGIDGRWYILQLGPVLCHSSPLLQNPVSRHTPPVRQELLRDMLLESCSVGKQPDFSFRGVHRHMLQHAIPRAVRNAVSLLPQGSPESRKPDVLLRDGFMSMMLHDHGINMCCLYTVYEHCLKLGAAQTPLGGSQRIRRRQSSRTVLDGGDVEDPEQLDDYVAGMPPEQLHRATSTHNRRVLGGDEDGLARAAVDGEYYKLLAHTCCMEMFARTLKDLARLDVLGGFTTTASDFKTSTTVRVDMVNRLARLAASRDRDFLYGFIMPHLKAKFKCPEEFELSWDIMTTGALLKVLSLHLGAEYGVVEGRFHAFAAFAQKKALFMFPTVTVDAMLNRDERRMQQSIAHLWDDANRVLGRPNVQDQASLLRGDVASVVLSPLHAAFVVRALLFSIITRSHRQHILAFTQSMDVGMIRKGWPIYVVSEMSMFAAVMEDKHPGERCEQHKGHILELLRQATDSSGASASYPAANRQMRDDISVVCVWLLHLAFQLLRSRKTGAVGCARRAVEYITGVPHIDFVFHAPQAQLLKDVEAAMAELDSPALHDYLHGVVEAVVSTLRRWNRMSNAARYLQRVTAAMMDVVLAEESADGVRVTQLNFSVHATLYGSHDPRTLLALYHMCLCALTALKSGKPSVSQGIHNLRKVISKHQSLGPALQVSFGRTTTVHTLLSKLQSVLEESGDAVTLASLRTALFHADRYRGAVVLLQSVGRGYVRRQLMRVNGLTSPFAPPQRPSSMVYFDGQVPLTLGQAANLGISLEDDSTRARWQQPADAQSDVSSITGSFMSGSNTKQRFSNSTSLARSVQNVPRGSSEVADTPERQRSFSILSPVGAEGHGFMDRTMSTSFGAELSSPPLHRPVPQRQASAAEGAPQLPQGPVPQNVIQRVLALQDGDAPRTLRHAATNPPGAFDDDTLRSGAHPQSTMHRGKTVANAWNFDVPYVPEDEDTLHMPASPGGLTVSVSSHVGRQPELSRSYDHTLLSPAMSSTAAELFALCDKDSDGFATVKECVDGVAKLQWMPVDDLRNLFASVAVKHKRSGITGFFSKAKEGLSAAEFQEALMKAGIMGR